MNIVITRNRRTVAAVVAIGVLAVACGGSATPGTPTTSQATGARPASTAKISFVSPKNGAVISGKDVKVVISLKDATIVTQTSKNIRPDQGHIHLSLDNRLISMNYGLDATIPDVPAGQHFLTAEFVASDHAPFDPRDFAQVTFEVQP
jgi:hypothetical protein